MLTTQPFPAELMINESRPDWRTCKRPEAILIQAEMNQLTQFDKEEQEEMASWTLYGQNLLKKDPFWFHDAFPHYPPDDQDPFQKWYKPHPHG